jgi:type I restriction enzyme R subunit
MPRNEAQTRLDLIDPALHDRGWRGRIQVEETTLPQIDVVDGEGRRRLSGGRMDYLLVFPLAEGGEPVPLAIIEAKREDKMPDHGLQQGMEYRLGRLHHVPFVFSSNGHQFVCYDEATAEVSEPAPMADFPTPGELVARFLASRGLSAPNLQFSLLTALRQSLEAQLTAVKQLPAALLRAGFQSWTP